VVIHEIVVGLVAAAGGAVMSSAAGIVVAHGCEVLSDYVLYIHKWLSQWYNPGSTELLEEAYENKLGRQ
jgi:hypothetical protein